MKSRTPQRHWCSSHGEAQGRLPERWRAIGLMSGTSCDGVTAALVELQACPSGYRLRGVHCLTVPYGPLWRRRLLAIAEGRTVDAARLATLHAALGERLAVAALHVARHARVPLAEIDLIGSHGHTIFHGPPGSGRRRPPCTLQIGEPAVIAARTGITTVADFRPADIALGGQGAPLAPFAHWSLFADKKRGIAIHNLGGISNLTYLPPGCDAAGVVAFDTGPGNMVIDAVVAQLSRGRRLFDREGAWARRGRVHAALLAELLDDPFLRKRPPKSTGRERYGTAFAGQLLRRARQLRLSPPDIVATATAFTAQSIARAYQRFVLPRGPLDAIYFAGGGSRNQTLLRMIARELPGIALGTTAELGVPPSSLEPICFAVLACHAVRGLPNHCPAATGSRRLAVLGKIVPGTPPQWQRLVRKAVGAPEPAQLPRA